jgi:fucose 4-O-acetylase-like acetyltransferase
MALSPSPAEVEASTPTTRDRAIDVIRIVSLFGVVVGHTVMATSDLRDNVFIWSNLLTFSPVFQALTWVFQIMPLFFFAGVAASVDTWTPGTRLGNWLMRRCTRLYRPAFYYLAFCGVTLTVARMVLAVAVGMMAVNVALVVYGPYELSLVGIETQQLTKMTPPSLLLAGHAIMMCALAIAAAPAIVRWAHRPRVWRLVAIGNTGAMTLYLWHIPPLLAVRLAFDYLGYPRFDPATPGFIVLSVAQLLLMAAVVAMVIVALRPLENNPLPLWDGGLVATPGARSAAVGVLLCVAGAATLASAGWGLNDQGLPGVAVMLVALIAARRLASRSCAGTPGDSLPVRASAAA